MPLEHFEEGLGPVLSGNPGFVYKKAPTLNDKVAPGVIQPHYIGRVPCLFF